MPPIKRHRYRTLLSVLILLVIGVTAISQRQAIYDYARLYNYQVPAEVSNLATVTSMTDKSRHDFYVNHPHIQDKQTFNQSCPNNGGEQTIILGCYIPVQNGIYIYRVADPQLNGVQEVTAAHEMLHGAYDRLNQKDRQHIDGLLEEYFSHLTDQRLIDIFAAYKKSEPNDLNNEMHSIFATEVANLPPALENYYKQYFINRQKVVAYAAQYQLAFSSRKDQITDLDSKLRSLKIQIDANQATLKEQDARLSAQREALSNILNSGNTLGYNSQVDSFNSSIQSYNALVGTTKDEINQYNKLVETRNAIAVETQNLAQELNSNSNLQTQTAR
ncbi:MAG: hypothetical protein WCJ24_00860 [Candidatus Saccharibacteria bacterium]